MTQPRYAMAPIPRWNQDSSELQWYAGYYLPVPIDPHERDRYLAGMSQETKDTVERYIKNHPSEFPTTQTQNSPPEAERSPA